MCSGGLAYVYLAFAGDVAGDLAAAGLPELRLFGVTGFGDLAAAGLGLAAGKELVVVEFGDAFADFESHFVSTEIALILLVAVLGDFEEGEAADLMAGDASDTDNAALVV